MAMSHTSIDGKIATVSIVGTFALTQSMEVEADVKEAINQRGCTQVVIDLSKTKILRSSATRVFKKIWAMVGNENFKLVHADEPAVQKAIQTARLDEKFTVE